MTPQKQRYIGPNAEGYGDCHRTCIAMILNLDRDQVPHFMENLPPHTPADHPASAACLSMEQHWLSQFGLCSISIPFAGETNLNTILDQLVTTGNGAPVILGCTDQGGNDHSVVVHQGQIYNPNYGDVGGPMRDGHWWITVISVAHNWTTNGWRLPLTN